MHLLNTGCRVGNWGIASKFNAIYKLMLYSLVICFFCLHSDSYHKELIGTESELHCLVTTFVTSAILSADYFCLVRYRS